MKRLIALFALVAALFGVTTVPASATGQAGVCTWHEDSYEWLAGNVVRGATQVRGRIQLCYTGDLLFAQLTMNAAVPANYVADATVIGYGKTGNVLTKYSCHVTTGYRACATPLIHDDLGYYFFEAKAVMRVISTGVVYAQGTSGRAKSQ